MSAEDHSAEDSAYYLETVLAKIKQTICCPLTKHEVLACSGAQVTVRPCKLPPQPSGDLELPDSGLRPTPHSPVLQSSEAGGRGGN